MKKVAVLLCGSGFKDGSEIREAVATLHALSVEGIEAEIFSLNEAQADVVNCLTNEPANETRNQLVESARIARGKVKALETLNVDDFSALIIPGGFGAAKNLCTFAFKGSQGQVTLLVEKAVKDFFEKQKPIGVICIAPAVVALALKGKGIELTVGEKSEASGEIEKLGHKAIYKAVHESHTDSKNRIVSTPAYMYDDAALKDVFTGIHSLVREVARLSS